MDIKVKTPFEFVDHVASIYGWANLKEKLGVSKQSISNWKLGKREPSAEVVLKCVYLLLQDEKHINVYRTDEDVIRARVVKAMLGDTVNEPVFDEEEFT
jgi:transcriptional regulator with XRE-family HTH domain